MVPHMLRPGSLAAQEALHKGGDCVAWHSACQHQERHLHVQLQPVSTNMESSSSDKSSNLCSLCFQDQELTPVSSLPPLHGGMSVLSSRHMAKINDSAI